MRSDRASVTIPNPLVGEYAPAILKAEVYEAVVRAALAILEEYRKFNCPDLRYVQTGWQWREEEEEAWFGAFFCDEPTKFTRELPLGTLTSIEEKV